jgi:serine phosphatase RsbU (regulator of sigma subunit)
VDNELYNFKELDFILRDLISVIKGQVDFLCIGGLEELAAPEKEEYLSKLQKGIDNLYASLNHNIVIKAQHLNDLMKVILTTKEELEKERNELKKRNYTIEQDLLFARKIQRHIIPLKSDDPHLGLFYKPMDQLGGDFFDIIRFQDPSSIGFFICDVSGHGTAASMVTTIIKSLLTQLKYTMNTPSDILFYMNQFLINLIAGNFVTGFMGALNLKTGILSYSSAGHNLPIVINENGVSYLKKKYRGLPLAVMSNVELALKDWNYSNERCRIKKGSRLLFYTDGLTESIPVNSDLGKEVPDFEALKLRKVLMKYRKLPPQDFLQSIYGELEKFRGSSVFDDDISMICYDY